jgi:hypothetical protein
VSSQSIQRLVEQQASLNRDLPAIVEDGRAVTYHDLNSQANAVARYLLANGFRRGGHAIVRLPRGAELAVLLLAVLKCGGSYIWLDPSRANGYPSGVSIAPGRHGTEHQVVAVDVASIVARTPSGPNLPVLTRGSDIACVLPDDDGAAAVLVPHATITSLCTAPPTAVGRWVGEQGALDLWLGLMLGKTVAIAASDEPATRAA